MVTLAHSYAVTLALQLHLLSPGPAYYPKMRMDAIESLAGEINELKRTINPEGVDNAIELGFLAKSQPVFEVDCGRQNKFMEQ